MVFFFYRSIFFFTCLFTLLHAQKVGAVEMDPIQDTVQRLHTEWAVALYHTPENSRVEKLERLLKEAHSLLERYPERAEPLIIEGLVLYAYVTMGFDSDTLHRIKRARKLLQRSIDVDPRALEASAYVFLGRLYECVPGWPISYGDNLLARQYFESAWKLFPDAFFTNYFYGNFLLHQGELEPAQRFFEKARKGHFLPNMENSASKIREEAEHTLASTLSQPPSFPFLRWFVPVCSAL